MREYITQEIIKFSNRRNQAYSPLTNRVRNFPLSFILSTMEPIFKSAVPVIPSADCAASLRWWITICGFEETFRDNTPPNYAGIKRGEAQLHISAMTDKSLARQVGDQTMIRFAVSNITALYAEYQQRGGQVHPNGKLQTKPWGTIEFAATDPNGVCVTFQESR